MLTVKADTAQSCEYCKKPFKKGSIVVMLEMDCRTGKMTHEPVEEKYSQGFFPVGLACAKNIKKNLKKA